MPCNAGSWIQKAFDHYWHDWSKVINLLSFIELHNISWKIFICAEVSDKSTDLFRGKIFICEECLKFVQTSDMKGYSILLKMKFLESPCLPSSHLRFQILCRKIWESFELSQNSFLWMLLGNIRNKIRLSFLHVSPRSFCILSGIPGVYKKKLFEE